MVKQQRERKEEGQTRLDILYDLLARQQERLNVAMKFEQENQIVTPEAGEITKSIIELTDKLNEKEEKEESRYY